MNSKCVSQNQKTEIEIGGFKIVYLSAQPENVETKECEKPHNERST